MLTGTTIQDVPINTCNGNQTTHVSVSDEKRIRTKAGMAYNILQN
jgi:hypothetical protein